ncbi:MAG: translocation/assembly module TamB domain-containing protein [Magnetococcales bacterium]|nr:translocation/assembly module TamB domain-containing protein [Magnetococcales bacterium]
MSILFKSVAALLLLVVGTIAAGGVLVWQWEPVRQRALAALEAALDLEVIRFQGIGMEGWGALRLERLEIKDRQGSWLSVEQATGRPVWGELARGVIRMEDVRARRVGASRPPIAIPASAPVSSPSGAVAVASVPFPAEIGFGGWSWPIPLRIQLPDARVDHLELGEALLLALPPVWRHVVASLPAQATVAIDLAQLTVAVNELQAASSDITLTGNLLLDLDKETIQADFHATLPEVSPLFVQWPDLPLQGAAQVDVNLTGAMIAPITRIDLASAILRRHAGQAQDVRLALTIDPPPLTPTPLPWPAGMRLKGQGSIGALHPDPPWGAEWPTLHPDWTFDARFTSATTLQLEQLTVNNAPAWTATAQGELQWAALSGKLRLKAQSGDLTPFARLLPWPLRGGASATLEVTRTADQKPFDLTLTLDGERLQGLPEGWQPLIGPKPHLQAHGLIRPDKETLEAQQWRLTGQGIRLEGSGELHWPDRKLATRFEGHVADLEGFSRLAGRKLAGSGSVKGQMKGVWSQPAITLAGEMKDLRVENLPFRQVRFSADLADLSRQPNGVFDLDITQPQGVLALHTRYRLVEWERLQLDDLKITAPRTRLTGKLAGDLRQGRVTGQLKGSIEDLAALQGWHGQKIGGRVELDLDLNQTREGAPQGHVHARIKDLTGAWGRMEGLRLDGRVGLERNKPVVEADLEVNRWQREGLKVEGIKARAQGNPERIQFSGEGRGLLRWPYALSLKGSVQRKGEVTQVEVGELNGRLDKEALRLTKPLLLTLGEMGVEIKPWEATLGGARLNGAWKQQAQRVDGRMELQGDLALLNRLGLWPMRGSVSGEIQVSGHADRPDVTAKATLAKGRSLSPGMQHLPPLNLNLLAQVHGGRESRIEAVAQGFTHEDARGELLLPVRIQAHSPWLEWMQAEPLQGKLHAGVNLADLGKWLGLEDRQRMQGILQMDLTASGTPKEPRINGSALLKQGRFELAEVGTTLHNIDLRLRADGDALILDTLQATDGQKGTFAAQGRIGLDPGRHFPVEIRLDLTQAMLVRRDDAQVTASGPLRIQGNLAEPFVKGTLIIHRALLQPPTGTTAEIAVVELDELQPAMADGGLSSRSVAGGAGLEISLEIPGHAFLRGRGLDAEWSGDLRVSGTSVEPQIAGQLRVRRGTLDVLERRFQLTSGAVNFDGAWPPAPWIDMEATVRRGEITTHVGVEGTLQHPKVKLTSEPILSEEEILSHLLFNRASDSITPAQAVKLAMAVKSMQGGGPGIMGKLQKELGIDRLDVGGESVETGTVSAGKYLTDEIYLEVEKGMKADSGRINVEVEMTPSLYLKTGVDAKSNGDIGVQWKKDY